MEKAVVDLTGMGFSETMALAAVRHNSSQDLDVLVSWIIENSDKEAQFQKELKEAPVPAGKKENLKSISDLVNRELADKLMAEGFSKFVAEKAVFMSGGADLEESRKWIEEHKKDADFEEELFIVLQEENKPKLTEAEAKLKAKELQAKIREERRLKEEADALERERNRMKGGKELVAAKREMEEAQRRRDMELQRLERERDNKLREQMREQLERDKAARMGKVYTGGEKKPEVKKVISPLEQFKDGLQLIKTTSPYHVYEGKAKTAYDTMAIYIGNVLKSDEQKFRKINATNKAFQSRVEDAFGSLQSLEAAGFVREGDFLVLQSVDKAFLSQCLALLKQYSEEAARA